MKGEEKFYRCPKCGHPYFKEERLLALIKDPVYMHMDDFQKTPGHILEVQYKYYCAQCGEYLDRAALARARDVMKARHLPRPTPYVPPVGTDQTRQAPAPGTGAQDTGGQES